MSKRSPTAVPARQFFGKYSDAIEQGHAADRRPANVSLAWLLENAEPALPTISSPQDMWNAVEEWWPLRLVRLAAEAGDSEGCKRLLHYFLLNLGG